MLEAALALLEQGYSIVPCPPDKRHPTIPWAVYQKEPPSPAMVEYWFKREPYSNIAIVTGKVSGVTVVVVDGVDGLNALGAAGVVLNETRIIQTPHGWHAYYQYMPGVLSNSAVYRHVDVKNDGGCVCAPPSKVLDGDYSVFKDLPINAFKSDPAVLTKQKRPSRQINGEETGWLTEALRQGAPKGERNHTASRLAGYLRSKRIPQDVAIELLIPFAEHCKPPMSVTELEQVIRSNWRYSPGLDLDSVYGDEA